MIQVSPSSEGTHARSFASGEKPAVITDVPLPLVEVGKGEKAAVIEEITLVH